MTRKTSLLGAVVVLTCFVSVTFTAAVFVTRLVSANTSTQALDPSIKAIRFANDYAVLLTDKPCQGGSQWRQAIAAKQPMSQATTSYSGCYLTNAAGQTQLMWRLAEPDAALSQSLPSTLNAPDQP